MEDSKAATKAVVPGEASVQGQESIELAGGKVRVTVGEEALGIQVDGSRTVQLTPQEAKDVGATLSTEAMLLQAEKCSLPGFLSIWLLVPAIALSMAFGLAYLIEHTPTPSGWEGQLTGWRKFVAICGSTAVAILSLWMGIFLGLRLSKRVDKLSAGVGWMILAGLAVWVSGLIWLYVHFLS